MGHGGRVLEHQTFSQVDFGLKPPAVVSKLGQFCSPHFACLLEEMLKVVGPFCLVSVRVIKRSHAGKWKSMWTHQL